MEKFQAGMVLGAVGDALGYRKGRWEFCGSGRQIQEELETLGGLGALKLDSDNWPLSDGALMHMTTAEALVTGEDMFILGAGMVKVCHLFLFIVRPNMWLLSCSHEMTVHGIGDV